MKKLFILVLLGLVCLSCSSKPEGEKEIIVFAAASTTDVVNELASVFRTNHHEKIKINFAASSTLARQIEAGADFDVYISANKKWMDYLEEKGLVSARKNLLANHLVLIAPLNSSLEEVKDHDFSVIFSGDTEGSISIGDPSHVPAGMYAKQSLENLGLWEGIEKRIIPAMDVREALRLVEMNEAPLGIVYSTDAAVSKKVKILGQFPDGSHEPIVYPIALSAKNLSGENQFFDFLFTDGAREFFEKYGFGVPAE